MAKVVYPVEVFDKQENGTIFYKDGALNDELRNIGPGILESWRYNFDEGKQRFMAEGQGPNEGIIYEKRLAKDNNGNPYWTNWLQIPAGEAKGIMAIAINEGPLRLPNSDGAIKLEITPNLLGVLSIDTAQTLMDQKIDDHWKKTHQFVPWPASDPTHSQSHLWALDQWAKQETGTAGGEEGILYVLAAKKNVDDFATQWVWNRKTEGGKLEWVQISGGDALEAWVSQGLFQSHVSDFEDHVQDEDVHVTAEKQAYWDGLEERIDEVEAEAARALDEHASDTDIHVTTDERDDWNSKAYQKDFEEHAQDTKAAGNPLLTRHVDQGDRVRWDSKMDGDMPNVDKRYVARLGAWEEAYEQVNLEAAENHVDIFKKPNTFNVNTQQFHIPYDYHPVGDGYGTFEAAFKNVLGARKGNIDKVTLTMASFNTFGFEGYFHTEDLDRFSPKFNSVKDGSLFTWEMGPTPFNNLYVEFTAPITGTQPMIGGMTITVTYRTKDQILFGDQNPSVDDRLLLNLLGPGDSSNLLYNGQPITGLGSVKWGDIVPPDGGSILNQSDLVALIADSVQGRLESPGIEDASHWVITHGDTWTKSLIQPMDVKVKVVSTIDPHGNNDPAFNNIPATNNNNGVKSGLEANFFGAIEPGFDLIATKITMKNVTADSRSNGIYFEAITADNVVVGRSPVVDQGQTVVEFEWTVPLHTFDRIVVRSRRSNAVQALSFIDFLILEARTVDYDRVRVSEPDKITDVVSRKVTVDGREFDEILLNGEPIRSYFWRYLSDAEKSEVGHDLFPGGQYAYRLNHEANAWKWDSRVPVTNP